MYLSDLFIRNSGPVRSLDLTFDLHPDGRPIPYVLIGTNGGGKTNVLSIIADALFEAAAGAFQDILPGTGLQRNWFRVVGSKTLTYGTVGGFSILRFRRESSEFIYAEKGGAYRIEDARALVPESIASAIQWAEIGSHKQLQIPEETARQVFAEGAYVYFPASRSEYPFWLNRESVSEERFNTLAVFSSRLGKPIFVEHAIEEFNQWLMSVLMDGRIDVSAAVRAISPGQFANPADFAAALSSAAVDFQVFQQANQLLQIILNDPLARFGWAGRRHPQKIGIATGDTILMPGLDSLSAGQASLLAIFGTLLRYGDSHRNTDPTNLPGICLIDEADAHMHLDLQTRALPQLMAMFPRIQFIVAGHSPLFLLGLERQFTERGVRFVEMPGGTIVSAEGYREFENALSALKETRALSSIITAEAGAPGKAKVWLEGETDPLYFEAAAKSLGFTALLELAEFEWIGAKDPLSGQGFNSGKDALDKALAFLRANPGVVNRPIILLYDSDAKKSDLDEGQLHVRSAHLNPDNEVARRGIENLLPSHVFVEEVYDTTTRERDYGESTTTRALNKMRLCKLICERHDPADFENFRPVLLELQRILSPTDEGQSSGSPTEVVTE